MPADDAPIAPVIQLGPVLVIPAPDSTAKLPAVFSRGSVAANAVAGQIRRTRPASPTAKMGRRIFITSPSCRAVVTKAAKNPVAHVVCCKDLLRLWIVPVQLHDPRVPVAEALPETLGLGDDDGHVGQLDLSPDLVRLRVHELADAVKDLLFHGQYLRVDLAPVEGLLERRIARYALAVHGLAPVATARRGVDVGPPTGRLDLIHSPQIRSRA